MHLNLPLLIEFIFLIFVSIYKERSITQVTVIWTIMSAKRFSFINILWCLYYIRVVLVFFHRIDLDTNKYQVFCIKIRLAPGYVAIAHQWQKWIDNITCWSFLKLWKGIIPIIFLTTFIIKRTQQATKHAKTVVFWSLH